MMILPVATVGRIFQGRGVSLLIFRSMSPIFISLRALPGSFNKIGCHQHHGLSVTHVLRQYNPDTKFQFIQQAVLVTLQVQIVEIPCRALVHFPHGHSRITQCLEFEFLHGNSTNCNLGLLMYPCPSSKGWVVMLAAFTDSGGTRVLSSTDTSM